MDPRRRIRLPSPAMTVALVALFVALSGTAFAVGEAMVPLAKRALTADKATRAANADNAAHALLADTAKKLGEAGTASLVAQAAQAPGPASSAAGLVAIKAGQWTASPGSHSDIPVMCDSGKKAIGGGWDDPGGYGHSWDSRPTPDGSGWQTYISVGSNAPSPQTGNVYAVCLK
jgi:hypothetical protein